MCLCWLSQENHIRQLYTILVRPWWHASVCQVSVQLTFVANKAVAYLLQHYWRSSYICSKKNNICSVWNNFSVLYSCSILQVLITFLTSSYHFTPTSTLEIGHVLPKAPLCFNATPCLDATWSKSNTFICHGWLKTMINNATEGATADMYLNTSNLKCQINMGCSSQ